MTSVPWGPYCWRCGRREHGSVACEVAWGSPYDAVVVSTRIVLAQQPDGTYALPWCQDCRLHVFNGRPESADLGPVETESILTERSIMYASDYNRRALLALVAERIAAKQRERLMAIIQPHLHLCERHREEGAHA